MQIDRGDIEELKQIHRAHFGREISDDLALEMGLRLLEVFVLFAQPVPKGHRCPACDERGKSREFDRTDP